MKKIIALLLIFPAVVFSNSTHPIISQSRLPNEPFQNAVQRVKEGIPANLRSTLIRKVSPISLQVPVSQMDFSSVTEVENYQEMIHMFNTIRDSRFLYAANNPAFVRRISWLYPDDGCFARAALSGIKLTEENLKRPTKIFAFGNLTVLTPYSKYGTVNWWYHVAKVVKLMGENYVLDPALNPDAPMLVDDWYSAMGDRSNLKGVVCNAYSYDPFDNCIKATLSSDSHALDDQLNYLDKEWKRVSSLGFDPLFVLGNNPPWIVDIPQ